MKHLIVADQLKTVVGRGGTKTVYEIAGNKVIFLPNAVDGQRLINIWPRIIQDELDMSHKLTQIGIPCLKVEPCQFINKDGKCLETLMAPAFAAYCKTDGYVIDCKNTQTSQWPRDQSLRVLSEDSEWQPTAWLPVIRPLILDINQLAKHGLYLPLDMCNLIIVKKGHQWHSGSDLLYEIRVFAFDFASKNSPLRLNNLTPLTYKAAYNMLDRCVNNAVWEILAPDQFSLSVQHNELAERVMILAKQCLETYDPSENDTM